MKNAFSLVELSIVLVILGLLTGGILGGQALIRAAELRSISSDVAKHTAAIHSFRDKYFALPGDMPNAVRFWGNQAGGTADGVDATCQMLDRDNPATGSATCNGNGNGMIGAYANLTDAGNFETFRAWQHMANAGLVEGSYAGVTDSDINAYLTGPGVRPGWNVPRSKLSNAGYALAHWGSHNAASIYVTGGILFVSDYGHVLNFGLPGGYHSMGNAGVILPTEAWNIDTKMDDGRPGTGSVMTPSATTAPGCVSSNDGAIAVYELAGSITGCALVFKLGF